LSIYFSTRCKYIPISSAAASLLQTVEKQTSQHLSSKIAGIYEAQEQGTFQSSRMDAVVARQYQGWYFGAAAERLSASLLKYR